MTFQQITDERVADASRREPASANNLYLDPPEWNQRNGTKFDYGDDDGVTYQQCGGGRRILRKKVGGQ